MSDLPGTNDHSLSLRAAHWASAALVAASYLLAWSHQAASSASQANLLLMLHRSVGVTILLLTVLRIGVRLRSRLPAWPEDLSRWQRLAATGSEFTLYAGLLGQPILGFVGSLARGSFTLFGITLPSPTPPNRPLAHELLQMHGALSMCLLATIILHIAAALQHHFIRQDDLLLRMLPALRRFRGIPRQAPPEATP